MNNDVAIHGASEWNRIIAKFFTIDSFDFADRCTVNDVGLGKSNSTRQNIFANRHEYQVKNKNPSKDIKL